MDDLPCYKPKSKRLEPDKIPKFSVCQCGHYWHKHDRLSTILDFLKQMFLFCITLGHYGGPCEECECNTYHFLGKFTYEQINQLQPCKDNDNDR